MLCYNIIDNFMTKPSLSPNEQAVLGVLRQHHKPLSAYDILDQLHGTKIRAAVQVYRSTEKLTELGFIHRLESLNAFVACDCAHAKSSPGFMLCTCCGDVREFDAGKSVTAAKSEAKGFRIETPNVELRGLCSQCQVENHTHETGDEARR
jgi:Fur family transcriptional regulator, zinc uptake regulator